MPILVIANDVIPGFGVPIAAPGIRAAGLIEGLRAHGHTVEATVPSTVLDKVWTRPTPPSPPEGVTVLNPNELAPFIDARGYSHVVFTNANMSPHLRSREGTEYIFDMFAPKILELLSSARTDRDWKKDAIKKERAMALADRVWVNGRRKIGYALGWLLRPSVDELRQKTLGKQTLIDGDPMALLDVVEMAVPLPSGIVPRNESHVASAKLRVGIAGYAQRWSTSELLAPAQRIGVAEGHDIHELAPTHWGGSGAVGGAPTTNGVTQQAGPLDYPAFARWIQSMDVVADAFEQTAERTMAMITRSAVAIRFGVPVIHGVDSEISDMIREADAGWVVDPHDDDAWKHAFAEANEPAILRRKQAGALHLSATRFDPAAALATAAANLETSS